MPRDYGVRDDNKGISRNDGVVLLLLVVDADGGKARNRARPLIDGVGDGDGDA